MYSIGKIGKVTFHTLLLTVCFTAFGVATAGGRGATTPLVPTIVKTAVDVQEQVIIITGRNFGVASPTVTLADQRLDVKRFSEREIVANLPSSVMAATYGVVVTTHGQGRANSNLFSATLPDIGKK